MQLSSRILTALAVLILAVAVVAVRAGSPGTVEAATGDDRRCERRDVLHDE